MIEAELLSVGLFKCKAGEESVAQVVPFSIPEQTSENVEPASHSKSSSGTQKTTEKETVEASRVIKFRIEIVPEGDSSTLRVQIVHKQGDIIIKS